MPILAAQALPVTKLPTAKGIRMKGSRSRFSSDRVLGGGVVVSVR